MSLPPISPSSRISYQIKSPPPNQGKFKTSSNIKIFNPLIPFKSKLKKQIFDTRINKAQEVMSPIPPPSLKSSMFNISRISPILPIIKPVQKMKNNTFLKQKYIDFLEKGRHSEFSVDYARPIKDYFQEIVESQKNIVDKFQMNDVRNNKTNFGVVKDIKISAPEVHISVNKQRVSKYSSLVMPFPRGIEKTMITKKSRRLSERENDMDLDAPIKFVNQSLQTDANSFEFDNWEFDYNA
ncbi:hypothetical protein SteCoe_34343 [Stentor coeruleus]|uniref:Uncharacterized protein n=1 Tax=Stentor coeruleus TaxID=5963 RepID=A0A1R2AUQ3_9CILI|nr:hypothetical protein SteCoe_34343 [Stentor coeruleus]